MATYLLQKRIPYDKLLEIKKSWGQHNIQELPHLFRSGDSEITGLLFIDDSTSVYGTLLKIEFEDDYFLYVLKDHADNFHSFDSTTKNINFAPEPRTVDENTQALLKQNSNPPTNLYDRNRIKKNLCKDYKLFSSINSNSKVNDFLNKNLRDVKSDGYRQLLNNRCWLSAGGYGVAGALWFASVKAREKGAKGPLFFNSSNFYMTLPIVASTHNCVSKMSPEKRQALLGAALVSGALVNIGDEVMIQNRHDLKDWDWPDVTSGLLGTLTYAVFYRFFENTTKVKFSQICK